MKCGVLQESSQGGLDQFLLLRAVMLAKGLVGRYVARAINVAHSSRYLLLSLWHVAGRGVWGRCGVTS